MEILSNFIRKTSTFGVDSPKKYRTSSNPELEFGEVSMAYPDLNFKF